MTKAVEIIARNKRVLADLFERFGSGELGTIPWTDSLNIHQLDRWVEKTTKRCPHPRKLKAAINELIAEDKIEVLGDPADVLHCTYRPKPTWDRSDLRIN